MERRNHHGVSRFLRSSVRPSLSSRAAAKVRRFPAFASGPRPTCPDLRRLAVDRVEAVTQVEAETMTAPGTEEASSAHIAGGACAVALRIAQEVENATIVFIVCDRGDRYLSTGVFQDEPEGPPRGESSRSAQREGSPVTHPRLRHRDGADVAGIRRTHDVPPISPTPTCWRVLEHATSGYGQRLPPIHLHKVVAIGCALRDGSKFKIASVGELATTSRS